MKRILLSIIVIGVLLLPACGGSPSPEVSNLPAQLPKETSPAVSTSPPILPKEPIEKPKYKLNVVIKPADAGIVTPESGIYEEGKELALKAVPKDGYVFNNWDGGVSGSLDTINVLVDSDKTVIANFKKIKYTLTINVSGEGKTWPPEGDIYDTGQEVEVHAIPVEGWEFKGWSGDFNGTSTSIKIVMDKNKTVTANFLDKSPPKIYGITVSDITEYTATIKWETDEMSTSQIEYGTTSNYGLMKALGEKKATNHTITLIDLTPNTTYYFRLKSKDQVGNEAFSSKNTFITKAFLYLKAPYLAESGLTVTVLEMTVANRSAFREYSITYTLTNNTPNKAIDEGVFKILFKDGGGESQYGFFSKLFPGESKTRSYTWKVLKAQEAYCIEFEGDFFSKTAGANTLKWLW